jgi:hypothetical protein
VSDTFRLAGMAAALCAAAFIVVTWLSAGAPIWRIQAVPLQPDARVPTFAQRMQEGKGIRKDWENSKTSQGDDDAKRNARRLALLQAANAYALSPCDAGMKKNLVDSLTAYTMAWAEVAGCRNGAMSCTRLDEAQEAFGTPLDVRVREAVGAAVAKGGIGREDFSTAVRNVALQFQVSQTDEPAACHAGRSGGLQP